MENETIPNLSNLSLSEEPRLCESCNQIELSNLIAAIPDSHGPKKKAGCGVPNWFEYTIEAPIIFPDVKQKRSSCTLCSLIYRHAGNEPPPNLELAGLVPPSDASHEMRDYSFAQRSFQGRNIAAFGAAEPGWYLAKSNARRVNTMEPVDMRSGTRIKMKRIQKLSPWQISIAADAGTKASEYVTRRPVSKQGSEQSYTELLSVIKDCDANHPRCHLGANGQPADPSPLLPTRVVDVGSKHPTINPRLIISNGKKSAYASLSHCWGGQRWVATTTQTISSMQAGFSLEEIPKTYADAIEVTRKLGLQYLWIDSFCIIQDSREDWAQEAANMGNVYERAHINIAATGAPDGRTGFLSTAEKRNTNGEYVYFTTQPDSAFEDISTAKLNTRGWVLQERTLSRRTIHLGRDMWYFECGTHIRSEDGWIHDIHGPPIQTTPSLRSELKESAMPIGKIFTEDASAMVVYEYPKSGLAHETPMIEVLWAQILRSYSKCNLSFASDKLPALQGVAAKFAEGPLGEYHYGHFVQAGRPLPLNLMWYAHEGGLAYPSGSISSSPRAPLWSALKADGLIMFHDCRGAAPATAINRIDNGGILLDGKLRSAKKSSPNGTGTAAKETFFSMSFTNKTAYGTFTNTLGPVKFDSADDVRDEFILLLTFTKTLQKRYTNEHEDQLAIALERVDGEEGPQGRYRRIGLAFVNSASFFGSVETSFLTIV